MNKTWVLKLVDKDTGHCNERFSSQTLEDRVGARVPYWSKQSRAKGEGNPCGATQTENQGSEVSRLCLPKGCLRSKFEKI